MNKVAAGAIIGCLLGSGVASPALAANVYDLNHHLVGELVGQAPDGSTLVKVNLGGIQTWLSSGRSCRLTTALPSTSLW
jgi:hypothetical protein